MTMGRKMKAGSFSSKAFISNVQGIVLKNSSPAHLHTGNDESYL